MFRLLVCWFMFVTVPSLLQAADIFPGTRTDWNGFERFDFDFSGKPLMVIRPQKVAAGNPWIWHGEFFGHKPAPDIALLHQGFHVVYAKIPNMLGSPAAVQHWDQVYDHLTTNFGLSPKVGLVGLSRGGLYCYNWAIANPDKVACIYGDAPVCDFCSWPGGFGDGPGSPNDWQLVLKLWGFENEAAARRYRGNPIDNLQALAKAGVPLLHVFGDADEVVPWQENTGLVAQRYAELGGSIELIRKAGVKHHPHGLDDPTPIVNFLLQHCRSPLEENKVDESSTSRSVQQAGLIIHRLQSPFQSAATELKVLLPDSVIQSTSSRADYSLLLVLPVEKQHQNRWGEGLVEVQNLNLHNRFQLICVEPSFAQLPWYADHPSNAGIRQESYLLQSVLPMLRWLYPEARHDRDGRLLVGFSKSGNGAWSLLLRNPQLFGKAAAWDAPLMLSAPGKYGSGDIYGSEENFRRYEISNLLQMRHKELLQAEQFSSADSTSAPTAHPPEPRLIHAGYGNFRAEHQSIEVLINELKIPHIYFDGPHRSHHWSSGWLEPLVQALAESKRHSTSAP